MAIATAIAIYFLIWWIMLFAVLPWGVRAQGEKDAPPGTDPGAPTVPHLKAKLLWTTMVASVVFTVLNEPAISEASAGSDGRLSVFALMAETSVST